MKQKIYVTTIMTLLICSFSSSVLSASPFERRRDQFQDTPGSLLLPFPYSIPGIGEGTILVGYAGNVLGTYTDVIGFGFTGDAAGYALLVDEFFVIPKYLYLAVDQGFAAKYGQNVYSSRGMESKKEDFNIFVGENSRFKSYDVVLTLFDRRLELTYGSSAFEGKFVDILDFEGEQIQELDEPVEFKSSQSHIQMLLDITDDYNDPRSGLKIRLVKDSFPAQNGEEPEYDTITSAVTYFVPLLKESTWAFHYFRSEAIVKQKGNIDLESLKQKNGFSYCNGNTACQQAVIAKAQNQLNANKNGTAKALGGSEQLRSYPLNRYQAAVAELYGTEFRWNFSTGGELNWFFFNDVIDSLQAAVFLEQGSVAEEVRDLGNIVRSSYGAGLRFVGRSGSVYRLDYATGDEGSEVTAFFEFPWSGFLE